MPFGSAIAVWSVRAPAIDPELFQIGSTSTGYCASSGSASEMRVPATDTSGSTVRLSRPNANGAEKRRRVTPLASTRSTVVPSARRRAPGGSDRSQAIFAGRLTCKSSSTPSPLAYR